MNNVYRHVLKAERGVKFRSDENVCRKSRIWIKVDIQKIQIGIKYRNGTFLYNMRQKHTDTSSGVADLDQDPLQI